MSRKEHNFPKSSIVNGKLCFEEIDDFDKAINYGVFYVKIPDSVDDKPGWNYCSNFYLDKSGDKNLDDYRGYSREKFSESAFGYTLKPDQIEQVQLEMSLWDKYFPSDLCKTLKDMNRIGVFLVEEIFKHIGIPKKLWDTATGNMASGEALQYCIFNHFRSNINSIGGNAHKDSGFITVLCMQESGQEIYLEEEWHPVPPLKDHFAINIGHSLEILTEKMSKPVNATYHRVVKTVKNKGEPDRHTFGAYIGPRIDMNLFNFDEKSQSLKVFKKFIDFQKEKAKEMKYPFHPRLN